MSDCNVHYGCRFLLYSEGVARLQGVGGCIFLGRGGRLIVGGRGMGVHTKTHLRVLDLQRLASLRRGK